MRSWVGCLCIFGFTGQKFYLARSHWGFCRAARPDPQLLTSNSHFPCLHNRVHASPGLGLERNAGNFKTWFPRTKYKLRNHSIDAPQPFLKSDVLWNLGKDKERSWFAIRYQYLHLISAWQIFLPKCDSFILTHTCLFTIYEYILEIS
jgi:hypothetical protein